MKVHKILEIVSNEDLQCRCSMWNVEIWVATFNSGNYCVLCALVCTRTEELDLDDLNALNMTDLHVLTAFYLKHSEMLLILPWSKLSEDIPEIHAKNHEKCNKIWE